MTNFDPDLKRRAPARENPTQKRTVGNMLRRNDFDRITKINPFAGFSSNPGKHCQACQEKMKRG